MQKKIDDIVLKLGRTQSYRKILIKIIIDWMETYDLDSILFEHLHIDKELDGKKILSIDFNYGILELVDYRYFTYSLDNLSTDELLELAEAIYKYCIFIPRLS